MKKIIIILLFVFGFMFLKSGSDNILIPSEAIRFRVIANSDSQDDLDIKNIVSRELQGEIVNKLSSSSDIDEVRKALKTNVPYFEDVVKRTLNSHNVDQNYNVNYGMNYFPKKIYKGVEYKEGEYESLVVTLGNGMGKNWWCVLFPPLCLLEAEESESEEVEYKFFVSELIDKYFN